MKDGDLITLDVPNRNLQVLISDEEMEARRAAWQPCAPAIPNRLVSQTRELPKQSKQRGLTVLLGRVGRCHTARTTTAGATA